MMTNVSSPLQVEADQVEGVEGPGQGIHVPRNSTATVWSPDSPLWYVAH